MSNKFIIHIIYPALLATLILIVIYILSMTGGSNNCPSGQHEEQEYGRYGDGKCVLD